MSKTKPTIPALPQIRFVCRPQRLLNVCRRKHCRSYGKIFGAVIHLHVYTVRGVWTKQKQLFLFFPKLDLSVDLKGYALDAVESTVRVIGKSMAQLFTFAYMTTADAKQPCILLHPQIKFACKPHVLHTGCHRKYCRSQC
jgi:hypothetical protein